MRNRTRYSKNSSKVVGEPYKQCVPKLVSKDRIIYKPRSDATPESELAALASVYAFVLEARARKKAAEQSGQDDAKEIEDVCATYRVPR